jgi:hypothetical protein
MPQIETKETLDIREPQQKETPKPNDRPICTIRGLFRDTRFIREEAMQMAQNSK